jgi:hypothetical protein
MFAKIIGFLYENIRIYFHSAFISLLSRFDQLISILILFFFYNSTIRLKLIDSVSMDLNFKKFTAEAGSLFNRAKQVKNLTHLNAFCIRNLIEEHKFYV